MKRGYDRFFTRMKEGQIQSYIFVGTNKTDPTKFNKRMFSDSVEFNVNPRKHEVVSNYPVIFEDFTTSDNAVLSEITWKDVPPPIKARYTRWKKLQSG